MMKRLTGTHSAILLSGKILFLSCIIILQFVFAEKSTADEGDSVVFAGVDTLVDKAIDLVYQKKYDDAIKMCEEMIQKYPDNPLGYLGQAGVYHLLMLNWRVSIFDDQFDSLTTLAIEAGNRAIKRAKQDANAYFVLGAAYGFRGLNRIRKGEWLGAFHDGLKGMLSIRKAHKLDPTLYDTYFALGLFYYWKSVKAKVLTQLRMMKDERDKGIEYLKIAIEKGRFSAREAKFALVEIYYYEDRYEEALQECQSLGEKFYEDPTWNYLMAKTLGKLNRWEEARTYFVKLIQLLEESPYKSYSFLSECHYGVARAAYEMGEFKLARDELEKAIALSKRWNKEIEIEGPLLDFDKVLQRMEALNKELSE